MQVAASLCRRTPESAPSAAWCCGVRWQAKRNTGFGSGTVQPSWTFPASESAVAACTYPGSCLFMRPWPERCLIPAFSSR